MDTAASDQANNGGQASHIPGGRAAPNPPGMTSAARQALDRQHSQNTTLAEQTTKSVEVGNNSTTSDQAGNGQTSRPLRKGIAVPMPPGMSEELRQANIKQYWEQKKLAEETAKNTEFNKNITSGQASYNQPSLSLPSKGKKVSISSSMAEEAR